MDPPQVKCRASWLMGKEERVDVSDNEVAAYCRGSELVVQKPSQTDPIQSFSSRTSRFLAFFSPGRPPTCHSACVPIPGISFLRKKPSAKST